MLKSTIVKWAVAAVLAAPASSVFAKPVHHALSSRSHSHKTLIAAASKHHRYHHIARRHTSLSTKSASAHRLSAAARRAVHTSAMSGAKPGMKVHVTKMPPTIDGINT